MMNTELTTNINIAVESLSMELIPLQRPLPVYAVLLDQIRAKKTLPGRAKVSRAMLDIAGRAGDAGKLRLVLTAAPQRRVAAAVATPLWSGVPNTAGNAHRFLS